MIKYKFIIDKTIGSIDRVRTLQFLQDKQGRANICVSKIMKAGEFIAYANSFGHACEICKNGAFHGFQVINK